MTTEMMSAQLAEISTKVEAFLQQNPAGYVFYFLAGIGFDYKKHLQKCQAIHQILQDRYSRLQAGKLLLANQETVMQRTEEHFNQLEMECGLWHIGQELLSQQIQQCKTQLEIFKCSTLSVEKQLLQKQEEKLKKLCQFLFNHVQRLPPPSADDALIDNNEDHFSKFGGKYNQVLELLSTAVKKESAGGAKRKRNESTEEAAAARLEC